MGLFILLVCGFLVSSCLDIYTQDTQLTLKPNGWTMQIELVLSGGSLEEVRSQLLYVMADIETGAVENGIMVDWNVKPIDDGFFRATIDMKGKDYESLDVVLDDNVITPDPSNPKQLVFLTWYDGSGTKSNSFTLRGAKVIDTNGVRQGRNTVVWNDPHEQLYARINKPNTNIFPYLLGIAFVGILVLGISRRQHQKRATQLRYTPQVCAYCGTSVTADTNFCQNCGKQIR